MPVRILADAEPVTIRLLPLRLLMAAVATPGCSARGWCLSGRAHTAIGQAITAQPAGCSPQWIMADVYAGTPATRSGRTPIGARNNGLMTGALELHAMGIRGTLPGRRTRCRTRVMRLPQGPVVHAVDHLAGRRLMALRVASPAGSIAGARFMTVPARAPTPAARFWRVVGIGTYGRVI